MWPLSSYKEPGELKISQLEGKKDPEKHRDEDSSEDEDHFEQTSSKKTKGTAKKRRTSGGSAAAASPAARKTNKPIHAARHSIDGSESLFGASALQEVFLCANMLTCGRRCLRESA